MEKFFGIFSALIVLASYPAYMIRIWQRKIIPNISSWIIFVLISVALCLSSFSSGGKENSWVTLGPLVSCTIILILALIRSKDKSLTRFDKVCLVLAIVSIILWFLTRQSKELVQIALCLGIFTDFIGILPSMHHLTKHPEEDRPGMWFIFSLGYCLSMFAIRENTFANWVLPIFMTFAPALVWVPLVKYRLKNRIPLKEWI
jgi:hypothetical protein